MSKFSLIALLESVLNKGKVTSNDNIAFNCPFCNHHKKKLQLNLETYKWHCWVCNERGRTFFQLLKRLKSPKRLFSELNDILGDSVSYSLPDGGMAIWIKINPTFSVNKLESVPQLHIKRIHTQENAFRFGFASMNEPELEEAVLCLKAALKN